MQVIAAEGEHKASRALKEAARRYERINIRPATALPSDPEHHFSRKKEFNYYFPSAYRFLTVLLGEK